MNKKQLEKEVLKLKSQGLSKEQIKTVLKYGGYNKSTFLRKAEPIQELNQDRFKEYEQFKKAVEGLVNGNLYKPENVKTAIFSDANSKVTFYQFEYRGNGISLKSKIVSDKEKNTNYYLVYFNDLHSIEYTIDKNDIGLLEMTWTNLFPKNAHPISYYLRWLSYGLVDSKTGTPNVKGFEDYLGYFLSDKSSVDDVKEFMTEIGSPCIEYHLFKKIN